MTKADKKALVSTLDRFMSDEDWLANHKQSAIALWNACFWAQLAILSPDPQQARHYANLATKELARHDMFYREEGSSY